VIPLRNIRIFFFLFLCLLPSFSGCSEKKQEPVVNEPLRTFEKELIHEVKSKYSHIKIYNQGNKRFLCFVRDNGDEVVESSIDLVNTHYLQLKYTQAMFGGLLLYKKIPTKTLMVGLGGGGMSHFAAHYFPDLEMKIVEIDPEILRIAKLYFLLPEKISKNIINEDIYTYLQKTNDKYEIIFMDAFLKPSKTTDETGISYKLKEKEFYTTLKNHLLKNGMVVFNINQYANFEKDIQSIRENFSHLYLVNRKESGNFIGIASTDPNKISKKEMQIMAEWIDSDRNPNYSFRELLSDFKD
jgi:spermidine synthase